MLFAFEVLEFVFMFELIFEFIFEFMRLAFIELPLFAAGAGQPVIKAVAVPSESVSINVSFISVSQSSN